MGSGQVGLADSRKLGYITHVAVRIAPDAEADLVSVPLTIRARIDKVLDRLEHWPNISGAKPLHHTWAGHYRVRTGDWRIIFRVERGEVILVRIMHRSKVYEG